MSRSVDPLDYVNLPSLNFRYVIGNTSGNPYEIALSTQVLGDNILIVGTLMCIQHWSRWYSDVISDSDNKTEQRVPTRNRIHEDKWRINGFKDKKLVSTEIRRTMHRPQSQLHDQTVSHADQDFKPDAPQMMQLPKEEISKEGCSKVFQTCGPEPYQREILELWTKLPDSVFSFMFLREPNNSGRGW